MSRASALVIAAIALVACGDPDAGTAGAPEPAADAGATPGTPVAPPSVPERADGPFDPDASMRPDLMVVRPATVAYGDEVAVTYPGGRERGVAYVLEVLVSDRWWASYVMTAATEGYVGEPAWAAVAEGGYGWEDIGIEGEGPDRLIIPPSATAGEYRICTANSLENICAPITVIKPDETGEPAGSEPREDRVLGEFGVVEPVEDLIGFSVPDFEAAIAERNLGPMRVAWKDGKHLDLTDDLIPGRVNVAVVTVDGDEVVTEARVEVDPETGASLPEAAIVAVYEGVGFYPACGNESLAHEGVTWYQVQSFEYPDLYDRAANGNREQAPEHVEVRGFARVVEPGPGDDVGTLVVWSDDVAYFVSDSGDLYAWLVTEKLEYPWEC